MLTGDRGRLLRESSPMSRLANCVEHGTDLGRCVRECPREASASVRHRIGQRGAGVVEDPLAVAEQDSVGIAVGEQSPWRREATQERHPEAFRTDGELLAGEEVRDVQRPVGLPVGDGLAPRP